LNPALIALILTVSAFDANHHPASAVKVYLQRAGQKEILTGQTDASGICRFNLPGGNYMVRAESKDLGEAASRPIKVEAATSIDLILEPPYADEPQFTVAGVKDNSYRGGHGADTVLRSSEELSKSTADLADVVAKPAGDPLAIAHELQQAAEQNPTEINLFHWGIDLLSHRAPQPATQVFSKGVRLFPQSVRMLLGLASAYYAAGSYDQSAHWFFQAVDLKPEDRRPYLFLGKIEAREITESPGYKDRFARFAKLHPEDPMANYYLAVKVPNTASQALLEKAITLDPHLALAYVHLGTLAAAREDYPAAISRYQQAIANNPNLEEAHFRLSEAFRITGDKLRSQQELATYRQLSITSSEKLEQERQEVRQFVIDLKSQ